MIAIASRWGIARIALSERATRLTEGAPVRSYRSFRRLAPVAVLALALVLAACSDPQSTVNPKSDFADDIQFLYLLTFWLGMAVFVGILGLTVGLAFWYRERPGRVAKQIHGNTRLEVLWTLIPVVLVVVMAVPTWQVIADSSKPPPDNALHVNAVGRQWWFEFQYDLNGDGVFDDLVTANELHIPAGRAVSFNLLSEDVIHSFWVPQLAGKVDMVPGHNNDLWFTPHEDAARAEAYLGQCAEFCGTAHANMRFRVFVDTPGDFDAWVANETAEGVGPADDLAQMGQELFLTPVWPVPEGIALLGCSGCHTVAGTTAKGKIGPNLTHVGARSTIAAGILDTNFENLVAWISNPDREKPGADSEDDAARFMPAFEKVLTPEQIQAIATYLLGLQ